MSDPIPPMFANAAWATTAMAAHGASCQLVVNSIILQHTDDRFVANVNIVVLSLGCSELIILPGFPTEFMMSYKPESYTDLAPYLLVKDANAVLEFCEAVFGATRLRVILRDDGGIMHAECRIGDTVLMMGEADGPPTMLHIYLQDPDAAFDRAVAAGAEVVQPMMEKGDGDRRGGVRAPDGTQWFVSQQVKVG